MINATVLYQNTETGDLWDLAPVTESIQYDTKRRGTPAKVVLDVITDIDMPLGGIVSIEIDEYKVFFGRLLRRKMSKGKRVTLTCYDQLQYMMRENTFIFRDTTLSGVIETIAKDFELEVGELNGPKEKYPTTLFEEKKALDIVEECINHTLITTGKMYTFWDEFGKLRLDVPENMRITKMLADGSIISNYDYDSNIEEAANFIKLVHDNRESGKREVYIYKDSENIDKWGHLQHLEMMNENANEGSIKQIGDMLLELKNRPQDSVSLEFSVGDLDFIAGRGVYIEVKEVGLDGWYILDEVRHSITARSHSMTCKLWIEKELTSNDAE